MTQQLAENWLHDIAVLNESRQFQIANDVSVYRTLHDLCEKLEPWFVEENLGFALTASGLHIELTTDGKQVFAQVNLEQGTHEETLNTWLQEAAKYLRCFRIERSQPKRWGFKRPISIGCAERHGARPESTEGLLAYIAMC